MPSGNAVPVGCTKIIYLSRITLVGNATIAISNQVGTTISYAIYVPVWLQSTHSTGVVDSSEVVERYA